MSEYEKTGSVSDSAMKADVDRHTARKYIEAGKCPAELQARHTWRTRPDPLDKIWDQVASMLRNAPELEAKTLFEHFMAQPDSGLDETHLRTFYRRVRHWRATQGPDLEVFFGQNHQPGQLLQLDWTHARELKVTIQGEPLDHMKGSVLGNRQITIDLVWALPEDHFHRGEAIAHWISRSRLSGDGAGEPRPGDLSG